MELRTIQDGFWDWLTLQPITGPILDKELRVTSRRRRYFVLRVVYLALLVLILAMVWADQIRYNQPSVMTVSRMAFAGQVLTSFVVWFQFIGLQVVAVILLSTAISEEIYHKTLGVLMTTPITAVQIVMGKLLSRLWQLMLLLGISLPVLAMVRVFGGIPWGFLATGLSLTLCTVLFVGVADDAVVDLLPAGVCGDHSERFDAIGIVFRLAVSDHADYAQGRGGGQDIPGVGIAESVHLPGSSIRRSCSSRGACPPCRSRSNGFRGSIAGCCWRRRF